MTLNGWLQIGLFLLAILAVTPPLGRFMTRVFNRERTWLDPVLRPIERLIYRVDRRRRDATRCAGPNTPRRCCSSASCRCWCSI